MDHLSSLEASQLATRLQLFWTARGLRGVEVWTEPVQTVLEGKDVVIFQVRSNIAEKLREHSYSHAVL